METTSFHCEGVDSKDIIMGFQRRVKGLGGNGKWIID